MKDIPANYTSALVPFAAASLDCLENGRSSANEDPSQSCILSGVMKSGRLAWIARGDALEVVNIATGARKAAWKFGAVLQEERSPTITCVAEYSFANAPKLLIGLETGVHAGMLCMFDVKTSKVVKAVDFMHKVTAVEPVTNVLATEAPLQVLSEHLRCFCGVVAVGTQYGHLYLIDMCLDDSHDDSDELLPHALHVFMTKARDVMRRRDDALTRGEILALHLNNNAQVRGTFQYVQPDGELLESYIAEEVFVTSLKFVHPIGTLIVGFNFGCFQMWRLYEPVLDFSSKLDIDDVCPITHFAYQEPENDPRNFCYLWVARGPLPSDAGQDIVSTVQLYQLSFQRRIWYDSYGVLYEDLLSVGVRLEHELLTTNLSAYHENVGSRVISCFTVENQRYQRPPRIETEDSFDEGAHGPDLSLCLFAWEVTSSADPSKTTCYLGLFDMNRWYHAQMPVAVRYSSAHPDLCAFFGMFSLDSVVKVTEPDDILAVHVDWDTVTRYLSHYVPPPELQFFPSSLAFSTTCVTETGVIQARFLGIQRQALSQLVWRGPIGLVEPFEVFNSCLGAGLLPKSVELAASNLTAQAQRENLLSVALNHGAAGFITSCVSQFAEGEFVHAGCTLRFILDWAWGKVAQVKDSLDKLCVPLYDCSGMPLEQQGLQLFHQHQLQLTNLQTIVQVLMTNSGPSTSQGLGDLDMKFRVVTLINQFYQAVSWCLSNNLLPEFDEAESPPSGQYCYPASVLGHEYQTRRQQISRLHSDIQETDLLMIDGMIDEEAAAVRALWSKQGGAGLYPPKSLHALLTIYLLENISLASKHSLVAYFFLDLISMMGEKDQNLVDRLSRFCQAIHLPQSRTRMIQGFWLLDHKDFEEAVLLLLDPMLLEEMLPWQHNRIIKAFLYQGEEKIALKFLRVKKPPLVTPEDVRLHLTVLLANGLISEAFEYQKVCSNNERDNDNLLGHLFTACQQTKTIDRLLQLPLTDGEERQLLQYLRDSKEARNMEILMLHFLQRARYVEAIRLNEKLGQTLLHESDPKTRERAAARNSIVECYSKVLPSVQRKLTFGSDHRPKKTMHLTRREIQRPRPLSTVVHHNNNQKVISNAMLINAVLEKIGETRPPPEQTPVRNRPQPSDAALGPFICTPVTPRARSNLISEDTDIIYPSIQRDARTEERSRTVSPVKKMVTGLMPQTSLASPVTAKNQNVNRILSTEALSLLQTPPVKRRTPPTLKKLTSLQRTPQSILKVRQVVKRSPSPSPLQQDQPQTIKRLSFLNADLALETPPRYQRKKVEVRKTKVKDTPKHLRFAGLSTPSPEPSPPKLSSSRRTRRRSPTPERTPPEQVTVSSRRPLRNDTDEEQTPTGSQKKTSVNIANDDIQVVDAEVTFNFDKSKQEEAIADEEAMETSEDDGSSIVTSTTSTGLGLQRVSFQLENNNEEQVLVSGDRDSPPTVDLTTTETESGEASLAPSSSEPLPNVEEEKMDIDENAESSAPLENDKNVSEKIKLQAGSVLREDETVTLAPLVVIPPDSVTSLEQPSPVRRSPRFAHSEISEQTSEFKTPPRPSHLSPRPISLPALPTPPESVRGSPTRSPSRLLRQRSASRSPSKSPPRHAPEMESTIAAEQVKGCKSPSRTRKSPSRSRTPERKAPSPTRTRGSSESPSGSPLSQEARAASPSRTIQSKGRKSPSRGTKSPSRSKSPVKDKDQAAENVEDVGEKSPTRRTRKSPARSKSPEKLSISPRRTRGSTPSRSDSPEKDQISRRTRGSTPTRTELPEGEQQISRRTRGSTPSRTESPERVPQSPGRGRNQRQSHKSTESKTSPSRPRSPEVKPKSPGRGRKTPAKSVAGKEKDRTPSPSKSPQGAPLGSRLRTRKATESNVPTEGSTETLSDKDKSPDSHAPVTRAKSPARMRKTPAENLKKSVIIEVDNLTSEGSPEVVLKSPSRQRKSGGRGKKTSSAKEPSTSEKSSEETETETEKEMVPQAKSPSRKGRKSPSRSPAAPQTTEVPQEEVKNAATVPKSVPRRATRATRASSVDSEVTDTDVPAQPSEVEETPVTSRAKSVKKIGAKTKSTGRSPARTRKAKKSEEKEQLQFTFSEPTVIPHDLESLPESLDMPGLPFVFSPPVTRTRSHKMEPLEEEEVIEGSPLGATKTKAKKEPKKAAAKKSTKTRKTTVSSPSDSPVSLLSPSTEEHQETSVPARTRVRRMASQSQSLRPKTSPAKKRKTVKK